MANNKPAYVPARQRRATELASRFAEDASRLAEEAATLRAHQPMARLAFLALVGMLLYLSTVAYNTSHLDLLLNTKVGVIWSLVELPRRWVLGVGSLVLAVIHYEAISLHHRVDRQFQAWYFALPQERAIQHRYLLWLHGGLISDQYSSGVSGRWLSAMSQVVLYGVMWVAPVLTLTFLQAVVMPVHSEWLSSSVRLSLFIVVLLVGYSAFQRYIKEKNAKPIWRRVRFGGCIAGSICAIGMYLSLHVFLWPGEIIQRAQAAVFPSAMVWDPDTDTRNTYRFFLGLHCGIPSDDPWAYTYVDNSKAKYGELAWTTRKPFNSASPQNERADYGNNTSYFTTPIPRWDCPASDEKTMVSTQLLRAWVAHQRPWFSPNYLLANEVINGRNLSIQERGYLRAHTASEPLHPKFEAVLDQVLPLNLSSEDLRFSTFCSAWMPKVTLPSSERLKGANFCGANLQGVDLSAWKESTQGQDSYNESRLNGVDLSGGALLGAEFANLSLGFTAIAASIDGLKLNGVTLANADWRLSSIVSAP
jgi:hypothetical protein